MSKKYVSYLSFAFVFMVTFIFSGKVLAGAPNSLILKKDVYTKENDPVLASVDRSKEAVYSVNGGNQYLWCLDSHRDGAPTGSTMAKISINHPGELLYVLEHSMAGGVCTLDNCGHKDYFAGQVAVWLVMNNGNEDVNTTWFPTSYSQHKNVDFVAKGYELYNQAIKAGDGYTSNQNPAISFENYDKTLTSSTDNKNMVSKLVKVKLSGTSSAKVSFGTAPSGTKMVDANGKSISEVQDGTQFRISVPVGSVTQASSAIKVNFVMEGASKSIGAYQSGNAELQRVVGIYVDKTSKTQGLDFTVNPVCQIINGKYYGKDGTETSQAAYKDQCEKSCKVETDNSGNKTYYNKKGEKVDEQAYKNDCLNICIHVNDKYYDKDGNETTKENYYKICETHTCEFVDNTYFGQNGDIIDKKTFESQCGTPVNNVPNTASNIAVTSVVAGVIIVIGATGFVLYQVNYGKNKVKRANSKK